MAHLTSVKHSAHAHYILINTGGCVVRSKRAAAAGARNGHQLREDCFIALCCPVCNTTARAAHSFDACRPPLLLSGLQVDAHNSHKTTFTHAHEQQRSINDHLQASTLILVQQKATHCVSAVLSNSIFFKRALFLHTALHSVRTGCCVAAHWFILRLHSRAASPAAAAICICAIC